jgi:polysaccharide export outer membrane protein
MATQAFSERKRWMVPQKAIVVGVWIVLCAGGCAQGRYRPSKLPVEFLASPTEKVDAAQVGRLARYTGNTELIAPGDLLDVTIDDGLGEESSKTASVWVDENGTARIAPIGPVSVSGLSLQQAGQAVAMTGIQNAIYVDPYPYVTVEMKIQHKNRVTVLGAVKEPGEVRLPRNSSYLLPALVAAGNLTKDAGSDIEIRHRVRPVGPSDMFSPNSPRLAGGPHAELASYGQPGLAAPRTIHVNLLSAVEEGQESHYLEDGDVVVVHKKEPRSIYMMGLVRKPDEYEMPVDRDLHLLKALAMAGERTSQLADKVLILRRVPGRDEPVQIEVSVREAKRNGADNILLEAGDVVSVEETATTFTWEAVKTFIRVGLNPISFVGL